MHCALKKVLLLVEYGLGSTGKVAMYALVGKVLILLLVEYGLGFNFSNFYIMAQLS